MDITKISIILEEIFKDTLEEPIYRFGLAGRKGLSNKIASGNLRNSIKAIPFKDAIGIEMDSYFRFVQSGRKSNKKGVPVDALIKWINERGLTGKDKKGKRMSTRSFAFAIQRNIKKFGIPSDPGFLDRAITKIYESEELANELGNVLVDELIDKIEGI